MKSKLTNVKTFGSYLGLDHDDLVSCELVFNQEKILYMFILNTARQPQSMYKITTIEKSFCV